MWTSSRLGHYCLPPRWPLGSFRPPELQACEELTERRELLNFLLRLGRAAHHPWTPLALNQEGRACRLRLECGHQGRAPGLLLRPLGNPQLRVPWKEAGSASCEAEAIPVQEAAVAYHPQEARGVGDRVQLPVHLLQLLFHDVSSLAFCLTAGTGPEGNHQRAIRKRTHDCRVGLLRPRPPLPSTRCVPAASLGLA